MSGTQDTEITKTLLLESQFFLVSVSNLGLTVSQRLEFTILYPSKKLLPILPRSLIMVMMMMMIKINYNDNNNDNDDYDDHVNNDDDNNSEDDDDDDDNSHVNNIIEALLFY